MADIRQGYERLTQDATLQVRFPPAAAHAVEPPAGPSALAGAGDLFWIVAVVILAVLAVVGVQAVRTRGRPRLPRTASASAPEIAAVPLPAAILEDADALAAAGQYGAAVHALLLRGVGVIQGRFPGALGPAHTSRDIAALAVLPPALRDAFSGIAARVEQAVFAQVPLGAGDWDACRTLYAGLAPQGARP